MAQVATDAQLMAALRENSGIISHAAKALGITRQSVWERCQRPLFQMLLKDIAEEHLDVAESNFLKAMKDGDLVTSRWYAERKGRDRGYGNSVALGVEADQLEAFVASLGGDVSKLRAALVALGDDQVAPSALTAPQPEAEPEG